MLRQGDYMNLACAKGAALRGDVLGRILHSKVDFEEGQWDESMGYAIAFGHPGVQFALAQFYCDLQGSDCRSQWNCFVKVMFEALRRA